MNNFFQVGPIPSDVMSGWYDWNLVILSYFIACIASYVALDITARVRSPDYSASSKTWWLLCGACAMGCGIWTMHFIGMLAFIMPMPMSYNPLVTLLSLLIAIIACVFAFMLIKNEKVRLTPLLSGGVFLGLAICSMHYTGMAAMQEVHIRYLPSLFALSVLIAIVASESALGLMILSSHKEIKYGYFLKTGSALIMGLAVCGMHYTGMAAAVFEPIETASSIASTHTRLNGESLTTSIVAVAILIMAIALAATKYWMTILEQKSKELQTLNKHLSDLAQAAAAREEQIHSILTTAPDGIIVTDKTGSIEICNRAAQTIFEYESSQMLRLTLTDLIGRSEAEGGFFPVDLPTLLAKKNSLVEYVGITRNNRQFPLELTIAESSQSNKMFYTVVVRNIEERKRIEQDVTFLNAQLVNAARLAGMAEVATCVLHNVGNVLNSINVTSTVLLERDPVNEIEGFQKLVELINQNKEQLDVFLKNDPVGRVLPQYLTQLAEFWKNEWKFIQTELVSLHQKVHHVKSIIAMQQSLSGGSKLVETLSITNLLENAIVIHSDLIEKYQIQMERDFGPIPTIEGDRVKTAQILVNLIKNAIEAVIAAHPSQPKISIRTCLSTPDTVKIEVIDNGIGIRLTDLAKIFTYGFTTKPDGHGFGLHSSVLAAQGVGGSLQAHSDGPNKGASFILSLPLKTNDSQSKQTLAERNRP